MEILNGASKIVAKCYVIGDYSNIEPTKQDQDLTRKNLKVTVFELYL